MKNADAKSGMGVMLVGLRFFVRHGLWVRMHVDVKASVMLMFMGMDFE